MKPSKNHFYIQNPHLEGNSFFWPAGEIGILLIHGFTATTVEVRLLARILHQSGYTVAGPLLPGHYTKPEDLNKVHWKNWVESVEKAYQEISNQCKNVIVGGESMGGLLSLYLASEHHEIPALLLYAPALKLNLRWFELCSIFLASPFIPYVAKEKKSVDDVWQGYPVHPLKGTIQLLKLQHQVRRRLKDIHQPTLIVQGKLDPTVHPAVPEIIYTSINSTHKEVHWMQSSGHCVILDSELEKVGVITLEFIRKVLNPSTLID